MLALLVAKLILSNAFETNWEFEGVRFATVMVGRTTCLDVAVAVSSYRLWCIFLG